MANLGQDVGSVNVGRATIKYGGRDLGFTEGEVTITYTQELRDFEPDQNTGTVKRFLTRENIEVTVPLAQWKAKDLAVAGAIAAGELKGTPVGGGGTTTTDAAAAAGATTLSVVSETDFDVGDFILIGTGASAEIAKVLSTAVGTITLESTTPLQFAHASGAAVVEIDIDKTRQAVGNQISSLKEAQLDIEPLKTDIGTIRLYKAQATGDLELTLQKGEETVVEVTFKGIMDISRTAGDQLFSLGDQTVT